MLFGGPKCTRDATAFAEQTIQRSIDETLADDGWVEYRRGVTVTEAPHGVTYAKPFEVIELMDKEGGVVCSLTREEVEQAAARGAVVVPAQGLPYAGLDVEPIVLRMGPHHDEPLRNLGTVVASTQPSAHVRVQSSGRKRRRKH